MPRAALSVAAVFRRYGDAFRPEVGATLSTAQRRVMTAIEQCRTVQFSIAIDIRAVSLQEWQKPPPITPQFR